MTGIFLTWFARRVSSEALPSAVAMASALNLRVLAQDERQVVLQTDRGDVLEFCGPAYETPAYLFADQEAVLGFRVDDLDEASDQLARRGFSPLAPTTRAGMIRYRHFRGPDDLVYGLIADA